MATCGQNFMSVVIPRRWPFVHHPAERREPKAHLPVVRIPTTGPGWIIDTLGHHEMDGSHSDRS
jgi:hypothetical protein